MTRTVLISSTEEGTGKTAVALALALLGQEREQSVGYMKPKGTRLQSHVGKTLDEDPMLARELLGIDATMDQLEPIVYSPTFVEQALKGHENPGELKERIKGNFDSLAADRDVMVLEGGGKYSTGGIVDLTDDDIADLVDAEVVLVSPFRSGSTVDDVLAAVDRFGDRLVGVLFNAVATTDFDQVDTNIASFLEARDVPVVGVLPRERDLAGITVTDLAAELNAEVLTATDSDGFVERLIVGAMGGDSALRYLRRTKDAAVITGGDRSDIHSVALESPGVSCLILTGGLRPPGAIIGKAEERGVPMLLVQTDTLATIDQAESVVQGGRTHSEESVEQMRSLLYKHADVESLLEFEDASDEE